MSPTLTRAPGAVAVTEADRERALLVFPPDLVCCYPGCYWEHDPFHGAERRLCPEHDVVNRIARAIADAEARGRMAGLVEAAKVAEAWHARAEIEPRPSLPRYYCARIAARIHALMTVTPGE